MPQSYTVTVTGLRVAYQQTLDFFVPLFDIIKIILNNLVSNCGISRTMNKFQQLLEQPEQPDQKHLKKEHFLNFFLLGIEPRSSSSRLPTAEPAITKVEITMKVNEQNDYSLTSVHPSTQIVSAIFSLFLFISSLFYMTTMAILFSLSYIWHTFVFESDNHTNQAGLKEVNLKYPSIKADAIFLNGNPTVYLFPTGSNPMVVTPSLPRVMIKRATPQCRPPRSCQQVTGDRCPRVRDGTPPTLKILTRINLEKFVSPELNSGPPNLAAGPPR